MKKNNAWKRKRQAIRNKKLKHKHQLKRLPQRSYNNLNANERSFYADDYALGARQRKYRENNREELKAYHRKYHEENREKLLAKQRKYHEENREKRKAYSRKYREDNREKINAYQRKRYHAKKEE